MIRLCLVGLPLSHNSILKIHSFMSWFGFSFSLHIVFGLDASLSYQTKPIKGPTHTPPFISPQTRDPFSLTVSTLQVMAFSTATKHSASLGTFLYNSMLNSGCASQSQRSCGLANAISSVGTVFDIGLRLLPNLSFHGVHVQCINIGGGKGEIPDNKHLQIALQHIHGIGRPRARQILSKLSIENKLARELTGRELYALREELNNYMCAHELNNQVTKDIARLMEIQCYRGIRHSQGLPCRGQRTHTNARTWKGKAIPVAGKKKA